MVFTYNDRKSISKRPGPRAQIQIIIKRMASFPEINFSDAYASWIDLRMKHFIATRERDLALQNEADGARIRGETDERAAELAAKISSRTQTFNNLKSHFEQHLHCLTCAKEGKLCDVKQLDAEISENGNDASAYVWIPQAAIMQDSNTPNPVSVFGHVKLEVWEERRREDEDQGENEDHEDLPEHVVKILYESAQMRGLEEAKDLRESIVQDQLRPWMARVSRPSAELFAAAASTQIPPAKPSLPPELFRIVSSFLDPFAEVLKAPAYYASLALRRRFRDLEKFLDGGFQYSLDSLIEKHPETTEIQGSITLAYKKDEILGTRSTALRITLGEFHFSISGPVHWPSYGEEQIVKSADWEAVQRKERTSAASDPLTLVRSSPSAAKYGNVAIVLREFFRRKGFRFLQEPDWPHIFTISWGDAKEPEDVS
ncbi:unnamed protein product [Amoebophrya sp. A120]|nr:unnamed protein product [Amoebophrya sp. A120]|eukprot:GSA120T00003151001.1